MGEISEGPVRLGNLFVVAWGSLLVYEEIQKIKNRKEGRGRLSMVIDRLLLLLVTVESFHVIDSILFMVSVEQEKTPPVSSS